MSGQHGLLVPYPSQTQDIAGETVLCAIGVVDGVTTIFPITEAQAEELRKKAERMVNFFVGRVLKENPNFSPQVVRKLVTEKLEERRAAYLLEHAVL